MDKVMTIGFSRKLNYILVKRVPERVKDTVVRSGVAMSCHKVVKVIRLDAFYKLGDTISVYMFGSMGCFDKYDRWVDYYDLGPAIQINIP
jgi:hypothetical protein